MARPRNDTYTVERNAVILIHEFGDGDVFVGDDALDGGDDEFVFERYPERLQRSLDIGRRDGQHNKVGLLEHLVHVARDVEAVGVEVYVLQVEGVGTVRSDAFAYLRFADIPRYSFFVSRSILTMAVAQLPAPITAQRAFGSIEYFMCKR